MRLFFSTPRTGSNEEKKKADCGHTEGDKGKANVPNQKSDILVLRKVLVASLCGGKRKT